MAGWPNEKCLHCRIRPVQPPLPTRPFRCFFRRLISRPAPSTGGSQHLSLSTLPWPATGLLHRHFSLGARRGSCKDRPSSAAQKCPAGKRKARPVPRKAAPVQPVDQFQEAPPHFQTQIPCREGTGMARSSSQEFLALLLAVSARFQAPSGRICPTKPRDWAADKSDPRESRKGGVRARAS